VWVTAIRGRPAAAVASDAAISEALSWAERCTREQPGDQVARDMGLAPLLEIGDRLRAARESDRASYVFGRAGAIAPGDPRVAFAAAGLPPAARDPAVALAECRSLRAGTSAFGERLLLYRAEGGLLMELGEWDAARRVLEKAVAVRNRPPMMETRLDLARCYEALGRPSDAAEVLAPLREPPAGPPAGR
jgi:tetratricopeptide (TPR) repeat protein